MRRLFIISLFFMCGAAYGQRSPHAKAAVSLDMASPLTKEVFVITVSHGIAANLSVDGSLFFPYTSGNHISPEFTAGLSFWPARYTEGLHFGVGCFYGPTSSLDMTAGCGYAIRIWRCLGLTIGYEFKIIENIKHGTSLSEGIAVKLNYIF